MIPSRLAISLVETPSAAIALTCAHSNALRTSSAASRSVVANGLETPDETGDNSRVAHFSIPRSGALLGSWRQRRTTCPATSSVMVDAARKERPEIYLREQDYPVTHLNIG